MRKIVGEVWKWKRFGSEGGSRGGRGIYLKNQREEDCTTSRQRVKREGKEKGLYILTGKEFLSLYERSTSSWCHNVLAGQKHRYWKVRAVTIMWVKKDMSSEEGQGKDSRPRRKITKK